MTRMINAHWPQQKRFQKTTKAKAKPIDKEKKEKHQSPSIIDHNEKVTTRKEK